MGVARSTAGGTAFAAVVLAFPGVSASQSPEGSGIRGAERSENVAHAYGQYEPKIPENYEKVLSALGSDLRAPDAKAAKPPETRRIAQSSTTPASRVTPPPVAAPAPARQANLYVGVGVGRSAFAAGFENTKSTIFSTGATTFNATAHAYDGMWKIYLGYLVAPRASVEAGYWHFGGPRYTADVVAPTLATLDRSFRAHGLGAAGVYWHPISNSLTAFGKAGLVWTHTSASAVTPGAGLTPLPAESNRRIVPSWGMGIKYGISPGLTTRLEYEYLQKVGDPATFGTANINAWSVGLNYQF